MKENRRDRIDTSRFSEEELTELRELAHRHNKRKRKAKKRAKRIRRFGIVFIAFAILYCVAVFSEIPVVAKWRAVYIQTAMTTQTHQWLATAFIPRYIIDEVMDEYYAAMNAQRDLESDWGDGLEITNVPDGTLNEEEFYSLYWELNTDSVKNYLRSNPDLTEEGYQNILIEDLDNELGLTTANEDPVLVLDTANNLMIIGVSGDGYVGKMAIVKNTEQVELCKAQNYGSHGDDVATFGENNDALVAINASRFVDLDGHGNGGTVKGSLVIDGTEYGSPERGYWRFAGLNQENELCISGYNDINISDYKWGVEVYPAIIVNGECVFDGSCMGIQPRAAIGQTQTGDFMLLIVDGRQVGYSLGCSVAECANILLEYNAYQAMNLDGGSSAVMWYNGEYITSSSSASGTGRYLPDAIVIKKASDVEQTAY